ncbi:MAG: restriction endonuclease subunit S [Gammaproteobacteria bacterium]
MNGEEKEIPFGWTAANIEVVSSELISGSGFPKEYQGDSSGEFPFAKVGDISKAFRAKQKCIDSANHFISEEVREEIKAKIFPKGTIVFPKIGEALKGNYRLVTSREMLFDNNVMGIVPNTKIISADFLFYFLNTQDLGKFSVATAVPSVRRGDVAAIQMLLPPINEQHRIVAKIEELFSELDKGIENLKTARAQLKVYRQALLKHAFEGKLTAQWRAENQDKLETADTLLKRIQQERTQRHQQQLADWEATGKQGSKPKALKPLPPLTQEELTELPEGWIALCVENLCDIEDGDRGEHYPTKGDFSDSGYCLFLNAKNVTKRGFAFQENSFISEQKHLALRKGTLKRGDIVFTSRGTLGNIAHYNDAIKYEHVRINSGMFLIRNYDVSLTPDFLYYHLNAPIITRQIEKLQSGTAQPQLPIREFKSFRFVIPGKEEQQQIVQELEAKLSEADQLDQTITTALQQAEALRQSILKKAFSGQLVPQDPHDEPASKLLARIKAERTDIAAKPRKNVSTKFIKET